jgi:chromosome segregation ATPase
MIKMDDLKREFLELLDRDLEFRYAVAGYLGLSEILKRLDAIAEEQVRLREEQISLREEQKNILREIVAIREEQRNIWKEIVAIKEEQVRLREDFNKLREEQVRLREDFNELRREQVRLREDFNKLREEQIRLREDFNRLREDFNKMFMAFDVRLSRVEGTLQKLTLDVEDEARSIIKYRLKKDFGIEMDLAPLFMPELELNIYGVSDDVCVVGEATVRAGRGILDALLNKIELLKAKYPEKLRKRLIPVIYVCLPMPELVEEAARRKVWVLKATQDFCKPEKA